MREVLILRGFLQLRQPNTDLFGGQVQVMFDYVPESIEYIRTGKLRPLAVTTAMRSEALPNIPTVGDFVPGYETSGLGRGCRRAHQAAAGLVGHSSASLSGADA
jgi:hypothetical protein